MLALLTVFLPIPGVNYMYEGLIKRGLVAMGGFFFLIFLIIFTGYGLGDPFWPLSLALSLTLPVYWLACLFDSLRVRRQINAGEAVKDEIDDMILFVKSHKRLILGLIVVLVAMSVISFIVTAFAHPLQQLLPYIVVGFGLYVLFSRPKRGGGSKPDNTGDNSEE
jgi:hypothetical protein